MKKLLMRILPDYLFNDEEDPLHPSLRRNTSRYHQKKWWFISRVVLPFGFVAPFIPAHYLVVASFFLLFIGLSFVDDE